MRAGCVQVQVQVCCRCVAHDTGYFFAERILRGTPRLERANGAGGRACVGVVEVERGECMFRFL